MALFKYSGTSAELEGKEIRDGFVYATVEDPTTDEVAQWYMDIGGRRYRVAAASLIDEDGNVIEIDQLARLSDLDNYVQKSDVIDVEHGGTNADNATDARNNLGVYSKDQVNTAITTVNNAISTLENTTLPNAINTVADVAYYGFEIRALSWSVGKDANGYYWANVQLDSDHLLTCGKGGNVPPSISINDRDNSGAIRTDMEDIYKAWGKVEHATATPYDPESTSLNNYITFYSKEELRTSGLNIPIIIIDHR